MKRSGPLRRKIELANRARVRVQRRVITAKGNQRVQLVKQLDELARNICMAKHGAFKLDDAKSRTWWGACSRCAEVKPLQWAHFNSRRIHALRWEPDNACPLCAGCHYTFAHHKPGEFVDWWLNRIGQERMERLSMMLKTPRRPDLQGLKVALTQEWASLARV